MISQQLLRQNPRVVVKALSTGTPWLPTVRQRGLDMTERLVDLQSQRQANAVLRAPLIPQQICRC